LIDFSFFLLNTSKNHAQLSALLFCSMVLMFLLFCIKTYLLSRLF